MTTTTHLPITICLNESTNTWIVRQPDGWYNSDTEQVVPFDSNAGKLYDREAAKHELGALITELGGRPLLWSRTGKFSYGFSRNGKMEKAARVTRFCREHGFTYRVDQENSDYNTIAIYFEL